MPVYTQTPNKFRGVVIYPTHYTCAITRYTARNDAVRLKTVGVLV